ncbi:MAG: hypothetical protein ACOCVF_02495 [bacterium]
MSVTTNSWLIVGVPLTELIKENHYEQKIPIYDKYTGKQSGLEKKFTYNYIKNNGETITSVEMLDGYDLTKKLGLTDVYDVDQFGAFDRTEYYADEKSDIKNMYVGLVISKIQNFSNFNVFDFENLELKKGFVFNSLKEIGMPIDFEKIKLIHILDVSC